MNMTSSIKSVNPATNKVEKIYQEMSAEEVDTILSKADNAYLTWKKSSFTERAVILHNIAKTMRDKKELLGKICTTEMGKLLSESISEVELCANIFDYYANEGSRLLADKEIDVKHGKAFLTYEPIGVLLTVQPWNFPFYQITRTAAANLMAGNTIVLKHASNIPQCAEIMEKIFIEAEYTGWRLQQFIHSWLKSFSSCFR